MKTTAVIYSEGCGHIETKAVDQQTYAHLHLQYVSASAFIRQ